MCVYLKGNLVLYTHAHWKFSSAGSLARFIILCMTAELFEFLHKNIPFFTGCVHRKYVDLSMLITWMSGIGYPMERNH